MKILICKDCNSHFIFTNEEQKYFDDWWWNPPIRCHSCREEKKKNIYDPYKGWESTMGAPNYKKPRHTRAKYSPYIISAFK